MAKKSALNEILRKAMGLPRFRRAYRAAPVPSKIALRLLELRRNMGLTQKELAHKLHVPQQTISRIERLSHTNLTLGTLERLAHALQKELVVDFR